MKIEVIYKLKSNPDYINYLHTHSYWYKYLNRDPVYLNDFLKEYKEFDRIIKNNKLQDTISTIDTLLNVVTSLNSK